MNRRRRRMAWQPAAAAPAVVDEQMARGMTMNGEVMLGAKMRFPFFACFKFCKRGKAANAYGDAGSKISGSGVFRVKCGSTRWRISV